MNKENYLYTEYKQGRRFFLELMPGESLAGCLKQFIQQERIDCAVIVSAIGSVKNVRLNDIKTGAKLPITAARLTPHEIEGPLELLSLAGNIVPSETGISCHLHIIASKSSGDVVGGHLHDAEVYATCEIVLSELLIEGIERRLSKSAGVPTIRFGGE
jgi:predicted DNA-binding protein with PD1-like motif